MIKIIKKNIFLAFFITFCLLPFASHGAKQIQEVNYFASLRAGETNVRSGPGSNYPIKYSFKIKNLPIKVISEYDNWCEIEDYEGTRGWIAQNLITKKRHLMTFSKSKIIEMYAKQDENSRILLHIENYVIGEYLKCEDLWCAVKINGKKGWIKTSDLYGIEPELPTEDETQNNLESQSKNN